MAELKGVDVPLGLDRVVLYTVRHKNIVSEIIDEEAIILDLNSGSYFSSDGAGAVIWDGIVCGFDDGQIKQRVLQSFSADHDRLDADFEKFAHSLLANRLVNAEHAEAIPSSDWNMPLPSVRRDYDPPALQQYNDMQDLALLDPIHDVVEEKGWPNRKTEF